MVKMKWKKDEAGRLAIDWTDANTQAEPAKVTGHQSKAIRVEFKTRVSPKPHLRTKSR